VEPFLKDFSGRVGSWLETATEESDVVVSTRIRIARNVAGYPFIGRMREEQAVELAARLRDGILAAGFGPDFRYLPLRETSKVCRELLLERHLISRELAAGKHDRGVAFGREETVGFMVNEEDHLRVQVILAGFALKEAGARMEAIDRALESRLDFAYREDFGYLTACPTNIGTGMRVSVMVHLPGLGLVEKEMKKVFNAAAKTNLAMRGLHGEGTRATGDFYQISNQVTLGRSEEALVADLSRILPYVLTFERRVRSELAKESRAALEDRIWRSYGLLRSARSITTDEAITSLSAVRLGAYLGLLTDVQPSTLNRLLVLVQPGHLQAKVGRELGPPERDVERAALLRDVLGAAEAP
jgi:protein arginine kinase